VDADQLRETNCRIPFEEEIMDLRKLFQRRYQAELAGNPAACQPLLDAARQGNITLLYSAHDTKHIDIEIFDAAHNIIGGGDKTIVRTKEQADHSLQYMVAAAILDDQVMPEQYLPERIQRSDVQNLLRKVVVRASSAYSLKFPNTMPCLIMVHLRDGRTLIKEKQDHEGFHTRPMT
jgi:2-methylcitrate dehydratase